MDKLPEELRNKIWWYLEVRDVARVRRVCKGFGYPTKSLYSHDGICYGIYLHTWKNLKVYISFNDRGIPISATVFQNRLMQWKIRVGEEDGFKTIKCQGLDNPLEILPYVINIIPK